MTIMFCSFVREPLILRLYGTARAVHPGDGEWDELAALFPPLLGARNIFVLDVDLVQTSCGYGVPLFEYVDQRELMNSWATKKGDGRPAGVPARAQPGQHRRVADRAAGVAVHGQRSQDRYRTGSL